MVGEKYTLEMKRAGLFLPRFLSRWKTVKTLTDSLEDVSFDKIKPFLEEDAHYKVSNVRQEEKSTVIEYEQTPNWRTEEYERYRRLWGSLSHTESKNVSEPVDYILYRITPNIKFSFKV